MQSEKTNSKTHLVSQAAFWSTLGAAIWLALIYFVFIDAEGIFVFMIAAIIAATATILSVVKVVNSSNWRGRLVGALLIIINLTTTAMSTFSIIVSHMNFMG